MGYSLHCNFEEICEFVNSIRPAKISTHWKTQCKKLPLDKLKKKQLNRMDFLKNMQQSGLLYLSAQYCRPETLSKDYKALLDLKSLASLQTQFGLNKLEGNTIEKNTKMFKEKYTGIIGTRLR